MADLFTRLTDKKRKDVKVLAGFIRIYCRAQHPGAVRKSFAVKEPQLQAVVSGLELCADCERLLEHGVAKLSLCPYDPKPSCRKCTTHCYAPGYRENVKKVMRFSGAYLLKRGRLDLLLHFLK